MSRNRVGAYMGTVLVLLVIAALLLAARDLWNVQARAVGGLLRAAGARNHVVESQGRLDIGVGAFSRAHDVRPADAPVIEVPVPDARRSSRGLALATLVAGAVVIAALTRVRRVPTIVKGAVGAAVLLVAGTLAYGAFWSTLPPLDTRVVLVDWRTSALLPVTITSLLFAYDLYPQPGSFVQKTLWLVFAVIATFAFSVVRMATQLAATIALGPAWFLPTQLAFGTFWDLAPGLAILAVAHLGVTTTPRARPSLLQLRRRVAR